MFSLLILVCLLLVLAYYIVQHYWSKRHLYNFSRKLPGPLALPLIGNTYAFRGHPDDYILQMVEIVTKYSSPMRLWLGSELLVIFKDPKQVEKILSSSKITQKHDIYNFIKPYAGEGMISGSGEKWKSARKLVQPLFNLNFVAASIQIFQKNIVKAIKAMDEHVGGESFDCVSIIHKCTADIIGETILGTKMGTQEGKNKKLMSSFAYLYEGVIARIMRPWLHPQIIFDLTQGKLLEDKHSGTIKDFFDNVVYIGKQVLNNGVELEVCKENPGFTPSILALTEKFSSGENLWLDDVDFRDNLIALYAASEDTITAIAAATCVLFGMYPEYQEKAFEEISSVITDPNKITLDHITQMVYLDMCVKDVLRLFPIAPVILRKTTEALKIDDFVIPEGGAILIPIINLHMNPDEWENPQDFHPDHFLPLQTRKRHAYSYIPFSAGPRGCIGKTFAQTSIKVLMANILLRFEIEADGKFMDIYRDFKADISVRPKNGYNIRIRRRVSRSGRPKTVS